MDTGGIVKVTNFDESSKSINNAFDKAIADHAEKMKRLEEQHKQEEESKSVNFLPEKALRSNPAKSDIGWEDFNLCAFCID